MISALKGKRAPFRGHVTQASGEPHYQVVDRDGWAYASTHTYQDAVKLAEKWNMEAARYVMTGEE